MLSGEQLKLFTKTGICSSVSSLHLHWRFYYDISGTIGDPRGYLAPPWPKNQNCEKQKSSKRSPEEKSGKDDLCRLGSLIILQLFYAGASLDLSF